MKNINKSINSNIIIICKSDRDYNEIVMPLESLNLNFVNFSIVKFGIIAKENYFKSLHKLIILLMKNRKEKQIVIGDLWLMNDLALFLLRFFFNIKIVVKLKGNVLIEDADAADYFSKRQKFFKSIGKKLDYNLAVFVLKHADHVLPVSNYLKSDFRFLKSCDVVGVPCDETRFRKKNYDYNKKNKMMKILAVTDFKYPKKIKCLSDFINKYDSFLEKNDLQIDIAGDGSLLNDFKKRYSKCRNVHFLGFMRKMDDLYSKYDIFVHFSYLDGYPNVVLEAQSSKLPVIVNNCCGMIEQIIDGKNGYIIDLKNTRQTKNKLKILIKSKRLREMFGENGLNNVRRNNSYKSIGAKLLQSLDRFIESKFIKQDRQK